jgi:hypothetical protein
MNNRIQELAELAKNSIPQGRLDPAAWILAYNQRLGELVAQECATICVQVSDTTRVDDTVHEGDVCSHKIKQHFGVAE